VLEDVERVTARSEQLGTPPLRWLLVPFAGIALVATVVEVVRRRATRPSVRPMSDEWLRDHTVARTE